MANSVTLLEWSKILNLLGLHLPVTRKGPLNLGESLQDQSDALFMTESPT